MPLITTTTKKKTTAHDKMHMVKLQKEFSFPLAWFYMQSETQPNEKQPLHQRVMFMQLFNCSALPWGQAKINVFFTFVKYTDAQMSNHGFSISVVTIQIWNVLNRLDFLKLNLLSQSTTHQKMWNCRMFWWNFGCCTWNSWFPKVSED